MKQQRTGVERLESLTYDRARKESDTKVELRLDDVLAAGSL